jgi:predicted GNAT family acetyltransferase
MADYESKNVQDLLNDLDDDKNVKRLVILNKRPQNMREIFEVEGVNSQNVSSLRKYNIGTWGEENGKKHHLHFYLVPKEYVNIEKIDQSIKVQDISDTDRDNNDTGINQWLRGQGNFNVTDVPTFTGIGGKQPKRKKKKIFLKQNGGGKPIPINEILEKHENIKRVYIFEDPNFPEKIDYFLNENKNEGDLNKIDGINDGINYDFFIGDTDTFNEDIIKERSKIATTQNFENRTEIDKWIQKKGVGVEVEAEAEIEAEKTLLGFPSE